MNRSLKICLIVREFWKTRTSWWIRKLRNFISKTHSLTTSFHLLWFRCHKYYSRMRVSYNNLRGLFKIMHGINSNREAHKIVNLQVNSKFLGLMAIIAIFNFSNPRWSSWIKFCHKIKLRMKIYLLTIMLKTFLLIMSSISKTWKPQEIMRASTWKHHPILTSSRGKPSKRKETSPQEEF